MPPPTLIPAPPRGAEGLDAPSPPSPAPGEDGQLGAARQAAPAAHPPPPQDWRNFYGRRHGKTLRPSQKSYLSEDLAPLIPAGIDPAAYPERSPIDPAALFATPRPVWLEIGFGGGEHMVHMAARNPEIGLIGCEPFLNGVAMLLGLIRSAEVKNLAVYPSDVRDLLEVLPDASIGRAFLNYPDPWPKHRHHRRRFVTPDHLQPLARVMAPGAPLRIATDIADYVRQARVEVPLAGFAPIMDGPVPWDDWPSTRYERKALREGRAPHYLEFVRAG